jgi:superfamily I DNA and/or RNA helicase
MEYFEKLQALLAKEKEEDKLQYQQLITASSVSARRTNGLTWYPVAIRDTELGRGDFLTVEIERTTQQDIPHQFRFGATAALFSNHNPEEDRIEGIVTFQSAGRLRLTLRTDELPDWSRNGKLGLDLLFDDNSYTEMQNALKQANASADGGKDNRLIAVLTGQRAPGFHNTIPLFQKDALNASQQAAISRILSAEDLAIVHGPPGTGKTTTLVQAIRSLVREEGQVLVVAPSNAAVDLLSEKLADQGLNVLRVGNPARVSERLMSLTLDSKMAAHTGMKDIKKMKKQANEYRSMAHKYKRNFGKAEREQRKALFEEAHKIIKEVEKTEQYIIDNLISQAQVITATLVGANHYTVRHLKYRTVVIDEAGQALEPACWIPILKAEKLVMAGDHCQLPPTIKSEEAAAGGLAATLLEKCIALHPEAVVMLEEQYRMHTDIMGYSSEIFYGQRLRAHGTVAGRLLFDADTPLAFIDTAGCGFEEKTDSSSMTNAEEASFAVQHLTRFVERLGENYASGNFPSIAVISPYRGQIELLQELVERSPVLNNYNNSISVNTIDSFQGQERDIVYISMTRSNQDNRIGFLSEIRRMNVAMTRARKKLVVIGDSATLGQSAFYAGFIHYAEQKNAYLSAWEFMDV